MHAIHGYMRKIQILFPEPLMSRLKEVAAAEDRPVSEIVRRATEAWLERLPLKLPKKGEVKAVPVFDGGRVLVTAEDLREQLYED